MKNKLDSLFFAHAICAAGVTKQPFIEELKIDIRFAISSAKECLRNGD